MEPLYKILDKHNKLPLNAIGFLTLMYESEELVFKNELSFLLYFRLNTYPESLEIMDLLVENNVCTRELHKTQIILRLNNCDRTLIIDNQVYKSNIEKKIKRYLDAHPASIAEKLQEIFQYCSESELVRGNKVDNVIVETFFNKVKNIDNRLMFHLYGKFKKLVYAKKSITFRFIYTIYETLSETYGSQVKTIERRRENNEHNFALSVVTGHAHQTNNIKYSLLLKHNKYRELNKYYRLGYELLEDKSQAYKGYSWHEDNA